MLQNRRRHARCIARGTQRDQKVCNAWSETGESIRSRQLFQRTFEDLDGGGVYDYEGVGESNTNTTAQIFSRNISYF